jgi:hypothetical protein
MFWRALLAFIAMPRNGCIRHSGPWLLGWASREVARCASAYGEEPFLAQKDGAAWQAYVNQVPRWLGLGAR